MRHQRCPAVSDTMSEPPQIYSDCLPSLCQIHENGVHRTWVLYRNDATAKGALIS